MNRLKRIYHLVVESLSGSEQVYTRGSIDRSIFLLSIPMILEMAMESLFAVVDAFFVGQISVSAIATVGLTESCLTLIYALAIGMSSAATAMVSRRIGEDNPVAASRAGAQSVLLALAASSLLSIPGYFFADEILYFMSGDPTVTATGTPFTRLMFTANLPIMLLWLLNGIFRGAGDAATAMRALWIANGINIILDPFLIFGWGPFPELGVLGAAVATTTGRSIGVAYQLWQLFGKNKLVHLRLNYFRPDFRQIRRLLSIAAGGTGQFLIGSASWIFMNYILADIGKEVTAGYTIAIRVMLITFLPCWGIANAAATLVGQNLGAGQPDRAEKSTLRAARLTVITMAFAALLYLISAPLFIGIFTTDAEALSSGILSLRILACGFIFFGLGAVMTQAINGAGDTKTPTLLNLIFFWLIEIPLAWVLAVTLNWGETGVYISVVAAESGLALAAWVIFRQGRWKKIQV